MIKLTSLCFTSLLLTTACDSSDSTVVPVQQRLIQSTTTSADGDASVANFEYSELGFLTTRTILNDGAIVSRSTFDADEEGRIQSVIVDNDADGDTDYTLVQQFVAGVGITRIYEVSTEGLISAVYDYNYENGLIVNRDFFEIEDVASIELVDVAIAQSTSRNAFEYEEGRVVTREYFDTDESLTSTRTFSYNADGTLESSSFTSVTNGTTSSTTYVYEEGRCTSEFELSFRKYHCVN